MVHMLNLLSILIWLDIAHFYLLLLLPPAGGAAVT
jgi:hypothetical protein